ncbi:uncharacterized protein LOC122376646 [Amphibalanus amphitrite]|uniref:uncharacterized protein LOC122376646 n=1 Tax=Amphibalanus amphitrite TaxID=1232801 RepID=UPI001C90E653|nr:uncharacterized protein LOC122376646 [Amphibalanus amphitrite]XP_043212494.1 uncharacterized protein LOC122376646 [Amphibalanus amphitrite]
MPGPASSSSGGGKPNRPLFAAAEERDMVAWISHCAALGLVITLEMFLVEVRRIVQLEQRESKSAQAMDQWVSEFRSRHSAKLGPLSLLPALAAAERCAGRPPRQWYRSVNSVLSERLHSADVGHPFSDPQRVLYLGEVNLCLARRTASVVALRQVSQTTEKTVDGNVAYVQALSASGELAPPMMVLPPMVVDDLPEGDPCFRHTDPTGCVTPTALIQYLVKSLEPYLSATKVHRPVLLYVDGLNHHGSMTLTQFCDDEGIIMVGLPPSGQARNPLRQAVTSLLAANFDRLVAEARLGRRKNSDSGQLSLSLKCLLAGIRQASRRVCKETVAQAFTSSSLFPWGEGVVLACQPVDGHMDTSPAPDSDSAPAPAAPASAGVAVQKSTPSPVQNGGPKAAARNGRPGGVSRTVIVQRADPDVTVKHEKISPPRSSPSPSDSSSGTDVAVGGNGAARHSHPAGTPFSDGVPDELVLPQARLTEYLWALDAAVIALRANKQEEQALVAMELKTKLRALHAASADLSGDGDEDKTPCAVAGCDGPDGDAGPPHRFPMDLAVSAIWLQRCRLSKSTRITDRLAVCARHFRPEDYLPSQSVDRRDRRLRPTAVPNMRLDKPTQKAAPASLSRAAEVRASRGIKRPKRYDDFECADDAPQRPLEAAPSPAAAAAAGASPDMTELANKPPAALKSIIGILRTENAELRSRLEAEQGRGSRLVEDIERLVGKYRAGAPR